MRACRIPFRSYEELRRRWSRIEKACQRSQEALKQKARRGALFHGVAAGYVKTRRERIEKDPDQRVQNALRLVFAKFAEMENTLPSDLRRMDKGSVNLQDRSAPSHSVVLPAHDCPDHSKIIVQTQLRPTPFGGLGRDARCYRISLLIFLRAILSPLGRGPSGLPHSVLSTP
jgi:hypothetical protein